MERYSATNCKGEPVKTRKDKLIDWYEEMQPKYPHLLLSSLHKEIKTGIVKSVLIYQERNEIEVVYISGDEDPIF